DVNQTFDVFFVHDQIYQSIIEYRFSIVVIRGKFMNPGFDQAQPPTAEYWGLKTKIYCLGGPVLLGDRITPHTHTHSHSHTVLSRSSIIPLRAKTRCTSKADSLWRALHHTTLIPGLRPGGLALGYKHSAPLGLGERLKS